MFHVIFLLIWSYVLGRNCVRRNSLRNRSRNVLYIIEMEHITFSLNPPQILPVGTEPGICLPARSSTSCCPEREGQSSLIQHAHTPLKGTCSADNLSHTRWVNGIFLLLCYSALAFSFTLSLFSLCSLFSNALFLGMHIKHLHFSHGFRIHWETIDDLVTFQANILRVFLKISLFFSLHVLWGFIDKNDLSKLSYETH